MMAMTFQRILPSVFVLLFAAAPVQAVQLNPDGLGQALIYPYYNAQEVDGSSFHTTFSIVNNTDDGKVVKIRFREKYEGQEVKDLNLFLAPRDAWTAALGPSKSGMKIVTGDKSCLSPAIGTEGIELSLGEGVGRAREGYIEAIEMATIPKEAPMLTDIVHVNGAPRDCAAGIAKATEQAIGPNTGGLSGYLVLMNVQSGYSFSVKATALDHFAKAGAATGYTEPKSPHPDLTSAEPKSVVSDANGDLLISEWKPGTADAVSAVLMHRQIINEFTLEEETDSKTNWVITFPTGVYYFDIRESFGGARASKLFKTTYGYGNTYFWAEQAETKLFDREGAYREKEMGFYPAIHVFGFNNKKIFLPLDYRDVDTDFSSGILTLSWMPINSEGSFHKLTNNKTTVIRNDGTVLKDQARTYHGLPTVGFSAYTMANAFIPLEGGKIGRSIYGVAIPHNYVNRIE